MAPPPVSAPSLHELEGVCDYCGEICDSTQDEMNAINCTFETCPSPMIYHQHCVEIYLKSIRLDKQRKTGFQCPRGNGKASKFDKPCPGRVSKSHPIHARNDNSKKRRKAKLPEPAPPPPPAPAPAPGKKPPGLPKSESKKGEKDKGGESKKGPASVAGSSSSSSSSSSSKGGSKGAAASTAAAVPPLAFASGAARSQAGNGSATRSLASAMASGPPRREASAPRSGGESTSGRSYAEPWSEGEEEPLPIPRSTPSLADFGYTMASAGKGRAGAAGAMANAWSSPRSRASEPATTPSDGVRGQRPPSPSEFVPLPSRSDSTAPGPGVALGGGPQPGQPTLAELLLQRASEGEGEADAGRNSKARGKGDKKLVARGAAKAKEKREAEEGASAADRTQPSTAAPAPAPAKAQARAAAAVPPQPAPPLTEAPPRGSAESAGTARGLPGSVPPSPQRPLRPWSEACVAVLRGRKREVFVRQLQELGFEESRAAAAVALHGGDLHGCLDCLLRGTASPAPAPAPALQVLLLDVSAELRGMEAVVRADLVSQELLEAALVASLGDAAMALDLLAGAPLGPAAADSRLGSPSSSSTASGLSAWDPGAAAEDSVFAAFGALGSTGRPGSGGSAETDSGSGSGSSSFVVGFSPFGSSFISDVARYNALLGISDGTTPPASPGSSAASPRHSNRGTQAPAPAADFMQTSTSSTSGRVAGSIPAEGHRKGELTESTVLTVTSVAAAVLSEDSFGSLAAAVMDREGVLPNSTDTDPLTRIWGCNPGTHRGGAELLVGSQEHSWQPYSHYSATGQGLPGEAFSSAWQQPQRKGPLVPASTQEGWNNFSRVSDQGSQDHLDDSLVSQLLNQLLL